MALARPGVGSLGCEAAVWACLSAAVSSSGEWLPARRQLPPSPAPAVDIRLLPLLPLDREAEAGCWQVRGHDSCWCRA